MERKEYLQLCKTASEQTIPDKPRVEFNGLQYYPLAYELRFDNGVVKHTAILHDLKANSVIYCDLEKVKEVKGVD